MLAVCISDIFRQNVIKVYTFMTLVNFFVNSNTGSGDFNEADEAVRQMVTTAWTDFAKMGNPGLSWTPQTPGSELQYININSVSPIMEYAQDIHDRMQLWTEMVGTNK